MQANKHKSALYAAIGLALLAGLFLATTPAQAVKVINEADVFIGPDQIIDDDLYLFGNTITIKGTVKGDVVAIGGIVWVEGKIEGDLITAGQLVFVNGLVGDDVRMAGQILLLGSRAQVTDHVAAAGMSLETQAGSKVEQDLLFTGIQAILAGNVGQKAQANIAALDIQGSVGGDVMVVIDEESNGPPPIYFFLSHLQLQFQPAKDKQVNWSFYPPQLPPQVLGGLNLQDTARIGGKLVYIAEHKGKLSPDAQIAGGAIHQLPEGFAEKQAREKSPATMALNTTLDLARRLVILLLVGLLMLRVGPARLQSLGDTIKAKPLHCLGEGVAASLAFLVAVIIVIGVTIILSIILNYLTLWGLLPLTLSLGILVSVILVAGFLILSGYVAQITLCFMGGQWLLGRFRPAMAHQQMWSLLLGLGIFVILTTIPIVRWLAPILVALLGLGALWEWGRVKLDSLPI